MIQFTVGDRVFKSKKAAQDKVKTFLYWGRSHLKEKLPEEMAVFLRDLIRDHHPDAEEKIGGGIDYFFVDEAGGEYKSTCFWFIRMGELKPVEFSYKECFSPTPLRRKVHMACRTAVAGDVLAAKTAAFAKAEDGLVVCEELDRKIMRNQAAVDHMYPLTFHTLVEMFLITYDIEVTEDLVKATGDRVFEESFSEEAMAEKFRAYHRKVVNHFKSLRIISKSENAKLGGQQRFRGSRYPITIEAPDYEDFEWLT